MKQKVSTITIVRDSEKYIVPHFRMYTGVEKNLALFVDKPIVGGSVGHGLPDNSESLIKKYCPNVEIHHTDKNVWGADIFNLAIELAQDCEKIVMLHADIVMDEENWTKLREYIAATDYDIYKLDMTKCTINYYADFEHGIRDCADIEPIAVASHVRYSGIYEHDVPKERVVVIDWLTVHHFTGWKGVFTTKEWLDGLVSSESNVYIGQMTDKWLPCPEIIRKMFI